MAGFEWQKDCLSFALIVNFLITLANETYFANVSVTLQLPSSVQYGKDH